MFCAGGLAQPDERGEGHANLPVFGDEAIRVRLIDVDRQELVAACEHLADDLQADERIGVLFVRFLAVFQLDDFFAHRLHPAGGNGSVEALGLDGEIGRVILDRAVDLAPADRSVPII